MSSPTASNTSQSRMPRKRGGFRTSAPAGRGVLGLEVFLARGSRGGEGGRFERAVPAMTVLSSAGAAASAEAAWEALGPPASKSPPGIVGARSCAGAVAAHSRSDLLSGAGGGAIGAGAGIGAADGSLPPQLLQKFAPSRFSVLHAGQIKAMTTDF
jgi:hypothetical protein